MTAKKINELDAKTPAITDLIPVADPATGVAGKSTVSQIIYSGLNSPVVVSTTGAVIGDILFNLTSPDPVQFQGVVYGANGKHLSTITTPFTQSNVTSLTISGVVGGSFTLPPTSSTWPSLTSLYLPDLVLWNTIPITLTYSVFDTPSLKGILGFFTCSCPNLVSLSGFSNLVFNTGNFAPTISNAAVTSLSLPNWKYSGNNFGGTYASATSFNLPVLETIAGNFGFTGCTVLASVNMPSLKFITGGINPSSNAALTSFTFPLIEIIGNISITSGMAALSTFTLGSSLRQVNGNVVLSSCALNQASVDNILVRLAALDGTGVTTAYSSRTVTITGTSATPSATGLAAKATLVSRGCTVTHN